MGGVVGEALEPSTLRPLAASVATPATRWQ